jgi:type IV pilus assembly protein PilA
MADAEGFDEGFTLIELMVVLLIMAILMAIAIPTFLGVRTTAGWRSAQSDLVNSATSLKSVFVSDSQLHYATPAAVLSTQIEAAEPEMYFTTIAVAYNSPVAHAISIDESNDGDVVVMADQSPDGHCWFLEINEEPVALSSAPFGNVDVNPGIWYGESLQTLASCSAASANGSSIFTGYGPKFPG